MYTPSVAGVHYLGGDLGAEVGPPVHGDLQLVWQSSEGVQGSLS